MISGRTGFTLGTALLVAAASLLLFGWLAEEVLETDTARFDSCIRNAVHGIASPGITSVMRASSFLGSAWVLAPATLVAILSFCYLRWYRAAVLMAATMASQAGLGFVLKHAFHRARPVPFFGAAPASYAFPSGHALGSLCFYGALAMILSTRTLRREAQFGIWTATALLVAMIGVSRIYLGVHYPSDVIAGYCAGFVWVAGIGFVERQ